MTTPLRMAVVAATGTARKRTIPAIAESSEVVVAALHARDQDRGRALADDVGAEFCADVVSLLATPGIDFVFVASPPFLHCQHVLAAVERGLPVLCEKPLASNDGDARSIAEAVLRSGVPFGVAHHVRHTSAYRFAEAFLVQEYGTIHSITAQWSFAMNRAAPSGRWKTDATLGGATAFSDSGIHAIDALIGLFGRPVSVSASGRRLSGEDVYSDASALVRFGDVDAAVFSSQNTPFAPNNLVIDRSDATLVVPGMFNEAPATLAVIRTRDGAEEVVLEPLNPYRKEVEDFVASLRAGGPFVGTTLSDALAGVATLDAIERSISSSATVDVDVLTLS